jgi:hypothetical protein
MVMDILNPPAAHSVTSTAEPTTGRSMVNRWYLPFARRMDMTYPSDIRYIIMNVATPVEDHCILLVQLLYRNDTEGDCSTEKLIAWDGVIVREDKETLESTNPDAILDVSRRIDAYMLSDRPGLMMRKRLLSLLHSHGEQEVTLPY